MRRAFGLLHVDDLVWAAKLADAVKADNRRFVNFARPGHFYSPLPDMGEIRARADQLFGGSAASLAGIDVRAAQQVALANAMAAWQREMPFPERPGGSGRFHLDNEFFSYGDAITLYGMMREFRPKRIVEVGSGFSSAAMLDVNERFFERAIEFTFIEPHAERLDQLLRPQDAARVRVVRKPVQEVPASAFDVLEAGDILFIDSSHVAKIGSDVLYLLFEVLPRLRPGVLVHVHDVLWPFEYPRVWVEDGRAWNEAYLLRAFLQYNAEFEILFFNSYLAAHHGELFERCLPGVLHAPSRSRTMSNSSLWLRRAQAR